LRIQGRRKGPVFRAGSEISRAKNDGAEIVNIVNVQRSPPRQPRLDHAPGRLMNASETCGYRGGVICDDQVAGPQQISPPRAWIMPHASALIDREELRVRRPLDRD
jgi:hypothetical protein